MLAGRSNQDASSNNNSNSAPTTPLSVSPEPASTLPNTPPLVVSVNLSGEAIIGNWDASQEWMEWGLLLFWYTLAIIAVFFASAGYDGPFLVFWWFAFSAIDVLVTLILGSLVKMWWRESLKAGINCEDSSSPSSSPTQPPTALSTFPEWKTRSINVYESWMWLVHLSLSTAVPFFLTLDLFEEIMTSVPSLIAEGLSPVSGDLCFALIACMCLINALPILQKCNVSVVGSLTASVALVSLVLACVVFPFSYDRPHKMRFAHEWDISVANTTSYIPTSATFAAAVTNINSSTLVFEHLTSMSARQATREIASFVPWLQMPVNNDCGESGKCRYEINETPLFYNHTSSTTTSPSSEIEIEISSNYSLGDLQAGMTYRKGWFRGTRKSRVCTVAIGGEMEQEDGSVLVGVWLGTGGVDKQYWKAIETGGGWPDPFSTKYRGLNNSPYLATLLRRDYGQGEKRGVPEIYLNSGYLISLYIQMMIG